jgi:hypothetical protein
MREFAKHAIQSLLVECEKFQVLDSFREIWYKLFKHFLTHVQAYFLNRNSKIGLGQTSITIFCLHKKIRYNFTVPQRMKIAIMQGIGIPGLYYNQNTASKNRMAQVGV